MVAGEGEGSWNSLRLLPLLLRLCPNHVSRRYRCPSDGLLGCSYSRLCRHHREGRCIKEDAACPFSHDPATVEPCRHLLLSGWCAGRACPFSHDNLGGGGGGGGAEEAVLEQLRDYYADLQQRTARFRAAQGQSQQLQQQQQGANGRANL